MHTLDESRLEQVFDALLENAHKLDSWQMDRLEEWYALWLRKGKRPGIFSVTQLEKIEEMYLKV